LQSVKISLFIEQYLGWLAIREKLDELRKKLAAAPREAHWSARSERPRQSFSSWAALLSLCVHVQKRSSRAAP